MMENKVKTGTRYISTVPGREEYRAPDSVRRSTCMRWIECDGPCRILRYRADLFAGEKCLDKDEVIWFYE